MHWALQYIDRGLVVRNQRDLRSHGPPLTVCLAALYSVLVVHATVVACSLLGQLTVPALKMKTEPAVARPVSCGSPRSPSHGSSAVR